MLVPTLLLTLFPAAGGERFPDSVELKDGRALEGRVIFDGDERVVLQQGSRTVELETGEVRAVNSLERSLQAILDHARVVPEGDTRALLDLARMADLRGLTGVGDLFRYRILLVDPHHEQAHEGLGHRKRNREWTVPLDGKWYRWRQRVELAADWNTSWELETAHYALRTNLSLEDAVGAALDLERFYLFYHSQVGREIGARGVAEPLAVHLHGDEGSYPRIARNRTGWYDPESRRVEVDATRTYWRKAMMHEATHQLLEVGEDGLVRPGTNVPAWVGEGLAEYLAYSASGPTGSARFQAGRLASMHVYSQAERAADSPIDAALSLGVADFLASSDSELHYARSYNLVHFCLHEPTGEYRESFLEFLADCLLGKGSPAAFKKLVARDVDEFEAGWHRYVASLSGGR